MGTNEVGNPEFLELEGAPAPVVKGSVSYSGQLKGLLAGDRYQATSDFTGPLAGDDVKLSVPEYTDTGSGFKIRLFINPRIKGRCYRIQTRTTGESGSSNECDNATYFVTASSPLTVEENEDPAKTVETAHIASFNLELDVVPEVAAVEASRTASPVDEAARARNESQEMMGQAGDAGIYSWPGAVISGSREAGFKITLTKTKELPSSDRRGKSIRKLTFTATIIPK